MANTNEHTRSSAGAYATIFGAVVTIGAVVLANKQVRNKVLKMVSSGIDRLTSEGEGVKNSITKTAEKVKDTVDHLVDDRASKSRKGAVTR